jgi:hypothetical protein
MDCSEARDLFYRETGRYVPIITDTLRAQIGCPHLAA